MMNTSRYDMIIKEILLNVLLFLEYVGEHIFSRGIFTKECLMEILTLQFPFNDFDNIR